MPIFLIIYLPTTKLGKYSNLISIIDVACLPEYGETEFYCHNWEKVTLRKTFCRNQILKLLSH